MRIDHWFLVLLAASPAAYAWWSGRAVRRAIDDPALPELLQARQRRIVQVAIAVIITSALMTAPVGFGAIVLLGLLAAQYPVRRAVYGDSWSFAQYARFTSFSWISFVGLWLYPFIALGIVTQLVQAWMPETSSRQIVLGLALGIAAAGVYLVWHRHFVRVWLALNQSSPLDAGGAHAALLPRFEAVLERAGARLRTHPTVYRYGAPGGNVVNAAALCSVHARAVVMSDTLLANLDADEATAVFAHEIAHHEHYTDAKLRRKRRASLVMALCIAVIPALQLATGGRYALAIDGLFVLAILLFFARGQQRHRAHETECDLRAVDLTGDADAVIRGLTRIHALGRLPRRFSQELERAATHPSLARRIQAIRAHATTAPADPAPPGSTVVATTTPGAYVAFDDTRGYWFEGAPVDAPLDVAVLRDQATSYRALAYRELGELRLDAERPRMLRAVDLAGRSWSVGIRDDDVAGVQAALDRVDVRLGIAPAEPAASSPGTARTVAALVLIATMMAGSWGTAMWVSAVALFAPSVASLAAMSAMALASAVLALLGEEKGMPYETLALAIVISAALWSAWIAVKWHRAERGGSARELATRNDLRWARTLFAVLGLGIVVAVLRLDVGAASPAALLGDPLLASGAVGVLGLGAAMLTTRRRASRLTGAVLVALSVAGIVAAELAARWATDSTAIAWSTGRLSHVASVPIANEVNEVALSPAGTRFLTRRWIDDEDGDHRTYAKQIVVGSIHEGQAARTFTALDAALPSEREVLVLAHAGGDSMEVRLERLDADSATRVAWRRVLPAMTDASLRLDSRRARWLVRGRRSDRTHPRLATISGAIDGRDVRVQEIPADTLRGQVVYSYADGASLVVGASPSNLDALRGRSTIAAYVALLRGNALTWTLWRTERDGRRAVKTLRGYPTCAPSAADDVAICVEQGRTATHLWRVTRDAFIDLGALPRRYDHAAVSEGGAVVASSYRGGSIAVVDATHRRGVRTSLPEGDDEYVREVSAAGSTVYAVLGSARGLRLAVYRAEAVNR